MAYLILQFWPIWKKPFSSFTLLLRFNSPAFQERGNCSGCRSICAYWGEPILIFSRVLLCLSCGCQSNLSPCLFFLSFIVIWLIYRLSLLQGFSCTLVSSESHLFPDLLTSPLPQILLYIKCCQLLHCPLKAALGHTATTRRPPHPALHIFQWK